MFLYKSTRKIRVHSISISISIYNQISSLDHSASKKLACVASVSVGFGRRLKTERKTEERNFRCFFFLREKWGVSQKTKEGVGGGERKTPPPPLSSFWLSLHFLRGKNTENPIPLSFVAPKPHGNACYAGYQGTISLFPSKQGLVCSLNVP